MDTELPRPMGNLPFLPAADTLLPHKPPMLFLEALIERQGTRTVAKATLPSSGLFVTAGQVFPEYFIELTAQTAALGNCYDAHASGLATGDGMLVGVESFSWSGHPQPGTPVKIVTEVTFALGVMKVIHGEVYAGKELLAAGDIKVWESPAKKVVQS